MQDSTRPAAQSGEGYTEDSQRGLSKLEYFAAAALNGLLTLTLCCQKNAPPASLSKQPAPF